MEHVRGASLSTCLAARKLLLNALALSSKPSPTPLTSYRGIQPTALRCEKTSNPFRNFPICERPGFPQIIFSYFSGLPVVPEASGIGLFLCTPSILLGKHQRTEAKYEDCDDPTDRCFISFHDLCLLKLLTNPELGRIVSDRLQRLVIPSSMNFYCFRHGFLLTSSNLK